MSALIQACKLRNDQLFIRFPIQRSLVHMILDKIDDCYLGRGQRYLARIYKTIILTGYYGLLRTGELTSGTHPVLACDTHIVKNKMKIQLLLRSSETHSTFDNPQRVTITTSSKCTSDILLTSTAHTIICKNILS